MRTWVMRKTGLLLSCLFAWSLVLLLSGCWDRLEVNDLAIILAAGLDKKDDKKVELSVQLFDPRAAGGNQQGGMSGASQPPSSGQTVVRSAEGVTVADAVSKLQEKMSRRVFWGHGEVFIFGEKLAREGIRDHIDFIMRAPTPRERADMFICKGQAKDILGLLPPLERSTAEALREMAKSQTGLKVTVKDFAQMLVGDAGAAVLPWIVQMPAEPGTSPKKTLAYINGSAVMKQDKLVGILDDRVTRGLLWLRNEVKTATVTLSPKEAKGQVTLKLLRNHTRLIPHIDDDQWSITVQLDTEDDVVQNTTNLDLSDPELTKRLEQQLAREIEKRIRAALVRPQKQMRADIFDFADAFHRKYPQEWRAVKHHWDDVFPQVKVKVDAKAKILRIGVAALKGKEAQKRGKSK